MDGPVDPSPVPSVESRERLLTFIRGYRISQSIYVATRLGIPDLLADGPREIDELAYATGSHPPSLRRVLLFLAGVGVLDKVGPDRFALTPVAAALRTGVPGSLRPTVLLLLDESHWRPWGHLLHTVRTGETAFHHAHGAGLFDYLAGHPEVASRVQRGHERQLARPRAPRRRDVRLLPDEPGGRCRRRTRPASRGDPRAVPSTARHPLRPASRHRGRSADPRRGGRRRPLRARRRQLLRRGARGRRRLHLAGHHAGLRGRSGGCHPHELPSRRWRPVRVSSL